MIFRQLFRDGLIRGFWWPALIIFWGSLGPIFAASKPQLSIGEKVSIYSDKAYRKNNGRYFEAVGNVVIISQSDTIYGELASLDQDSLLVKVEGNVRVITKDMTLYGSHIEYNIATGVAVVKNARILAMEFSLVASEITRLNETEYLAKEGEFTTCKDCTESWSFYGKDIRIQLGSYITIKHGLAKIKGVDVLYMPYLVLPIQTSRKSGLLFPRISSRLAEGLAVELPIFIAIDDSKDATVGPTFWAKRGYGGDVQYRQRFNEMSWFEANTRLLNDTIYEPGKTGLDLSGREFFRYFTEVETHQQFTSNLNSHLRFTGARDLDIIRDHPTFTDDKNISSDMGFTGFLDWRRNYFSLSTSAEYLRNQLFSDPLEFDRSYVQTVPRVNLATTPYPLIQSDIPLFQYMALGLDGSYTRFRQVKEDESLNLRNADRASLRPYLMWHMLNMGPLSLSTQYTFDQQIYQFPDPDVPHFGKNAGLVKTEFSFTMDRIFGLAYEEKIPIKYIPEQDLAELREKNEQGLTPLQKTEQANRLVGELVPFKSEFAGDTIVQIRNSYRHSQEYKFIHHYIASSHEYGNSQFNEQIRTNRGWFDYEDAIRSEENLFGSTTTRTIIAPKNTIEFQWNNTLIRKSPKKFSYLTDEKYLRDNFSYSKIGWFDVSQGYLVNQETPDDDRQRLTRLMVSTGYASDRWTVSMQGFYFHYERENIFSVNFNRRFDHVMLLANYVYNSFNQTELNALNVGGQVRPTDTLRFAITKEMDLESNKNMRTNYLLDIMPHNNCWILNFNYRDSLVDSRFSFNIMINYGDKKYAQYRDNYFGILPR